jgi:hypothetical protein
MKVARGYTSPSMDEFASRVVWDSGGGNPERDNMHNDIIGIQPQEISTKLT